MQVLTTAQCRLLGLARMQVLTTAPRPLPHRYACVWPHVRELLQALTKHWSGTLTEPLLGALLVALLFLTPALFFALLRARLLPLLVELLLFIGARLVVKVAVAHVARIHPCRVRHLNPSHPPESVAGGVPTVRTLSSPCALIAVGGTVTVCGILSRVLLLLFNTTRAHSLDPQARGPLSLWTEV